jgi:hypothetical protein
VVGQFEGKRPLGRPRQVGEMSTWIFREIRWEGVNWINLAMDKDKWWATVSAVMLGFFVWPKDYRNSRTLLLGGS